MKGFTSGLDDLSPADTLPMTKIVTVFLNMVLLAKTLPPARCQSKLFLVMKFENVTEPSQLPPILSPQSCCIVAIRC